jgi:hypothetical protein
MLEIITLFIISISILGLIYSTLVLIIYLKEKKIWNNGKCPNCGHGWDGCGVWFTNPRPRYNYVCKNCLKSTGYLHFEYDELEEYA